MIQQTTDRAQVQQTPKRNKSPVLYYGRSFLHDYPSQDPRPVPLEVFYVAIDVIDDVFEYTGVKISPPFRTLDEGMAFLRACGIHGAYCTGTELGAGCDTERERYEIEIFGGRLDS